MIKVSVIVPVYGVEDFIERCAESLFRQTLDDMEFVFVDDCTKDRSMEVLQEVIERHRASFEEKRWTVRTERMEVNSGLPAVRKRGVELAQGEYVAHCDSDDWVDDDLYRLMYTKAKEDDLDAVFCDHYVTDGSQHHHVSTFPRKEIDHKGAFDSMFADNKGYHSIWAAMYRASLYKKVEEYPRVNMGEDAALTAQLLFFSKKIGYIPSPLYYYYQRPGSIVQTMSVEKRWNNARQLMQNQELIIQFFQRQKLAEKYIVFAKLTARFALEGLSKESGFRQAWRDCYPEISHRILCNKDIPLRLRIKYLLLDTGLYNTLRA